VASRGIDVPEVSRVVHAELPESPETLTHRSGRTGRAGRKGQSIMLVPSTAHRFAESLLRGAGIFAELLPAPTPREVQPTKEQRLFDQLSEPNEGHEAHGPLAARLLEKLGPEVLTQALLARLAAFDAREPYPLTPANTLRAVSSSTGPRRHEKPRTHAVFRT